MTKTIANLEIELGPDDPWPRFGCVDDWITAFNLIDWLHFNQLDVETLT